MSRAPTTAEFSLANGGPAFRLLSRLGVTQSVGREISLALLLTWLPLLVLSAIQGTLLRAGIRLPFILDFAPYVRFLIAVPLLLIAERTVDIWLRRTVHQFEDTGIVSRDDPRFRAGIDRAIRMRNSAAAELVILALVVINVVLAPMKTSLLPGITTWIMPDGGFSAAGRWYKFVSLPIYQFLLYRWLWRYTIWVILVKRISGLNLQLAPAHPDRVGGLEFVTLAQRAFSIILLAGSSVLAATVADAVVYRGDRLERYEISIGVFIILVLIVFLLPLSFFTRKLKGMRLDALCQYDALGYRYSRRFHDKWVASTSPPDEELLGSSDIQSLADLSNAYKVVASIKPVLITLQVVVILASAAILPMALLPLAEVPVVVYGRTVLRLLRAILG